MPVRLDSILVAAVGQAISPTGRLTFETAIYPAGTNPPDAIFPSV